MTPGGLFTSKLRYLIRWLALFPVMITAVPVLSGESDFTISDRTLHWAEKRYGTSAGSRLRAWQDLIRSHYDDDLTKLKKLIFF